MVYTEKPYDLGVPLFSETSIKQLPWDATLIRKLPRRPCGTSPWPDRIRLDRKLMAIALLLWKPIVQRWQERRHQKTKRKTCVLQLLLIDFDHMFNLTKYFCHFSFLSAKQTIARDNLLGFYISLHRDPQALLMQQIHHVWIQTVMGLVKLPMDPLLMVTPANRNAKMATPDPVPLAHRCFFFKWFVFFMPKKAMGWYVSKSIENHQLKFSRSQDHPTDMFVRNPVDVHHSEWFRLPIGYLSQSAGGEGFSSDP